MHIKLIQIYLNKKKIIPRWKQNCSLDIWSNLFLFLHRRRLDVGQNLLFVRNFMCSCQMLSQMFALVVLTGTQGTHEYLAINAVHRSLVPHQIRIVRVRFLVAQIAFVRLGTGMRSHMQSHSRWRTKRFATHHTIARHQIAMNQLMMAQIGQSIELLPTIIAFVLLRICVYLVHVILQYVLIGKGLSAHIAHMIGAGSLRFLRMLFVEVQLQRTSCLEIFLTTNIAAPLGQRWFIGVGHRRWIRLIGRWLASCRCLMITELTVTDECLMARFTFERTKMIFDVFVTVAARTKLLVTYFTWIFYR